MPEPTQSQLVTAGSTHISTILNVPIVDAGHGITWRLISDQDGTIIIPESSDGIAEIDDGYDQGLRRYDRQYTAPSSAGRYLAIWRYGVQEVAQTIVVEVSPDATFATVDDVAARLGRTLTTTEHDTQVPFLLHMAAAVIAEAVGYDDGWAASLTPVPNLLRGMSVDLVCRAIDNPSQATQIRQQVGSYAYQAAWDNPGLRLSDVEIRMLRRNIHGSTTASVHVASGFEREQDEYWLRQQAGQVSGDPAGVIA